MKLLFIISFLFLSLGGYSQSGSNPPVGYIPIKGEGYVLLDADGRPITGEDGGILVLFTAMDTATTDLPQPPDTAQVFNIIMVNPGDVSTPGLANGVQAYWSFEETSGSTAYDSAASYDGTITNTPTLSETGISNLCYSYNAAGSEYVDFGTSFWDPNTDDLSVSCWIKTSTASNNGGIVGNWGTYPYWYIRAPSGSTAKGVVNFTGSNIETQTYSNLLVDYWYHIVYRLDRDGNATLHINNVLQADQDDISTHSAVNLANNNTHAIGRIGNALSGYYHNGLIDEVNVYDRLLSTEEISNLYNVSVGKFWPFGVVGGDTLNQTIEDWDARGDSVIIIWKYEGDGWSTDEEDGTVQFAFSMDDILDYVDTNYLWSGLGDTIVLKSMFTGLNDDWTDPPGRDSVFIDSSDKTPPIQDPGGFWDTIFYQAFEQHIGIAPVEYTYDLQSPDFNNHTWFDSDHRWPSGWAANPAIKDSLIIDPITGSVVNRLSFDDAIIQGYDGQTPARGGEGAFVDIGSGINELYLSYNLMVRPGFLASGGGKIGPGMAGFGYTAGIPLPKSGFKSDISWFWQSCPCPPGVYNSLWWYYSTIDSPGPYSNAWPFWDFQPVGDGLQYYPAGVFLGTYADGLYYMDVTDSTWFNITLRFSTNTFTGGTPNHDGLMEAFVNGYLVSRKSGLVMCDVYANRNIGLNQFWYRIFFGGGGPPLRDEWVLLDDIFIFTYDVSVDVPRGQKLSPPGRVLNLPNHPKEIEE